MALYSSVFFLHECVNKYMQGEDNTKHQKIASRHLVEDESNFVLSVQFKTSFLSTMSRLLNYKKLHNQKTS